MNIIKLSCIAITGVILAGFLKNVKSPVAVLVAWAVSLIILFYIVSGIAEIFSELKKIQDYIQVNGKYIAIIIKITGLSYITQLASDMCRDNGYSAIAGQLEIFCKISIAALSIPVISALFEVVGKCIQ